MTPHALVAGGSLAGLMAASLLRRAGWRVSVFERQAADLADRGGGIATQDALWAVLADAGIRERPGVRLRVAFALDGSVLAERAVDEIVSSWDSLYELLRRAFNEADYHRGCAVAAVRQDADGVSVMLEGGQEVSGHLVVAADGAGSAVRGQLLPDVRSEYANDVAWRGLVEEGRLDPAAHELLDAFSFCAPPGEQMLSYTIPGPGGEEARGRRRHNLVWYQPAEPERVLPDLMTDADGGTHSPNIPPTKLRRQVIEAMRARGRGALAGLRGDGALDGAPVPPAGRRLLLAAPGLRAGGPYRRRGGAGPSACRRRHHQGAAGCRRPDRGVVTTDDVAEAVRAYEAARLPAMRDMVEQGRWLGTHLDAANGPGGEDQAPDTLVGTVARGLATRAR